MAESPGFGFSAQPMQPSAYWGDEKIWNTKANNHNAMFDGKGRVWLAATIRGAFRTTRRPRSFRSTNQGAKWRSSTQRQ